MRLIDADALVEILFFKAQELRKKIRDMRGQAVDYYSGIKTGFVNAAIVANSFPTIEPKKGKWIEKSLSIKDVPTEACSVCGEWSYGDDLAYCPNCGAKMERSEDAQKAD